MVGFSRTSCPSMDLSKDYLRQAAKVHHDGHFAVVGLGRQKVFGDIARTIQTIPLFSSSIGTPTC